MILFVPLLYLFYLEKTLGIDEGELIKLDAEIVDYKEELDSLSDVTEEQKLEVSIIFYLLYMTK